MDLLQHIQLIQRKNLTVAFWSAFISLHLVRCNLILLVQLHTVSAGNGICIFVIASTACPQKIDTNIKYCQIIEENKHFCKDGADRTRKEHYLQFVKTKCLVKCKSNVKIVFCHTHRLVKGFVNTSYINGHLVVPSLTLWTSQASDNVCMYVQVNQAQWVSNYMSLV